MANGKFFLSKDADEVISNLMVLLEIDRPSAMKISLSKGILESKKYEDIKFGKSREIGHAVLLDGFEYTLFKQLIIQKEGKNILDPKELDNYISYYIEQGTSVLKKEMEQMTHVENFLLTLIEQPIEREYKTELKNENEIIFELLGL